MIGHSYVYMHNGHRDRTEWVYERDRVVRDTGRGIVESTVSEQSTEHNQLHVI